MNFSVFLYFDGYGTKNISGYQLEANLSMIIIHNKNV